MRQYLLTCNGSININKFVLLLTLVLLNPAIANSVDSDHLASEDASYLASEEAS